MSDDLKEEYSQYLDPDESVPGSSPKNVNSIAELHKEKKKRGNFTIQSLYKVETSISGCFEPYLQPYVEKERESLLETVLSSLQDDLKDPKENSTATENVRILNSSLHFINKVKHLMRRASSISSGETLYKIFCVLKEVLGDYLETIQSSLEREVSALGKSGKKDTNFFSMIGGKNKKGKKDEGYQEHRTHVLDFGCIAINTIDYIRETLDNIAESFESHLDSKKYEDKINFDEEEQQALDLISEIFTKFTKTVQPELDQVLKAGIQDKEWNKIDNAGEQCNDFVFEVESVLREYCHVIEKQISRLFFTKIMNGLCTLVNDRLVNYILNLKKVSESGGIQLLCGKEPFSNFFQTLQK